MTDTVADWVSLVHGAYPPAHASDWDNVGLQVGDPAWPVERVLVSLDVTTAVVDEAASGPPTLVLAHHPLLFRPLKTLTPSTASGRTALRAASNRVAVLAAHTNLDTARDGAGTSDPVAEVLELTDRAPLTTELRDGELKLVVFVPADNTQHVLDALTAAGAGGIGNYDRVSFRGRGVGSFRPLPGATPHTGTVGSDTYTEEDRLEVLVPRRRVSEVVRALVATHPYEEVAYDLIPTLAGAEVGFGVVGQLPQPLTLRAVAARLRDKLPAPNLRFAGEPERLIRRVATVGGAGDGTVGAAIASGADVFVTGDLRHHVTLDAMEEGLALIDAGHHATEVAALPAWRTRLSALAADAGLTAQIAASTVSTATWRG